MNVNIKVVIWLGGEVEEIEGVCVCEWFCVYLSVIVIGEERGIYFYFL